MRKRGRETLEKEQQTIAATEHQNKTNDVGPTATQDGRADKRGLMTRLGVMIDPPGDTRNIRHSTTPGYTYWKKSYTPISPPDPRSRSAT
jgi:hypothetical protein